MVLLLFLPAGSVATASEVNQRWLDVHNQYRALHGVSPVVWSANVAASAQSFADTCPGGHSGVQYGENLAWANTEIADVGQVVSWWYSEEGDYSYNRPGFRKATGHFTQIVWKDTAEIGCAKAEKCNGRWRNVWVCQYNPQGNYLRRFADNVFPADSNYEGEYIAVSPPSFVAEDSESLLEMFTSFFSFFSY